MAEKKTEISPNVDETMKELETHGSFELPVETYTDNCVIFRSLYNPAPEGGRSSYCKQRGSSWN